MAGRLNTFRDNKRTPVAEVSVAQKAVGLVVTDDLPGLGIEFQSAPRAIRGVGEVNEAVQEMCASSIGAWRSSCLRLMAEPAGIPLQLSSLWCARPVLNPLDVVVTGLQHAIADAGGVR